MKQILGSMTFADQVDRADAETMLQQFFAAGNREIDTAHAYTDGATETMLGQIFTVNPRANLYIASKVNPWNEHGLAPQQIHRQMSDILERLNRSDIDLLYLHAPDLETPVEKTLAACFELFQQGKFRHFGLSNYASWQVAEVVETCRRNGWMQPLVYQGMYNALTRDVERELFPCLRHYGIRFYAYNPLAGGLLSGKYASIAEQPASGRFVPERGYLDRYWKADYFAVTQELQTACRQNGLAAIEVAFSWLVNHSLLDAELGDGIILGASNAEHLRQNMQACRQAALAQPLIDILDRGWELFKPNCFKYFRP